MDTFRTGTLITITAVVLVGAGVAWGIYVAVTGNGSQNGQFFKELSHDFSKANTEVASQKAREFIQGKDPGDPGYVTALNVITLSDFHSLFLNTPDLPTTSDGIALVRGAKQLESSTQDPYHKAGAIFMLAIIFKHFQDPNVKAEVFKDEPYKALETPEYGGSINNLLKYSISLYPTDSAYIMLARNQADAIAARMKPGTSEPLLKKASALKDLQNRKDLIGAYLASSTMAASLTYSREVRSSLFFPIFQVWDQFWAAYALGGAARVDASYIQKAENAYQEAIQATHDVKNTDGTRYTSLKQVEAEARLMYARMLLETGGPARSSDIKEQLSAFVSIVTAEPSLHGAQYRVLSVALNASKDQAVTITYPSAMRNYEEFKLLAEISPEFKSLLNANGWTL